MSGYSRTDWAPGGGGGRNKKEESQDSEREKVAAGISVVGRPCGLVYI